MGALYVAVALVLTLLIAVPQVRLYRDEQPRADIVGQLRFLRSELGSGLGEEMQAMFPEGYFFSYALYGLAWTDIARGDTTYRDEALREARWALARLESPAGKAIFDDSLRPAHGVFYVGWSSRLRGAVIELAGPDAPETVRFVADCAALAAAFDTEGPFLEAYPGQAWPVDSVVAVAALSLHDRIAGPPRFGTVIAEWSKSARTRLDPATGLLPHRAKPVTEGARGSSQSVIQRFLPEIDTEWAQEQYRAFRGSFVDIPLGLPGVREYPRGRNGTGDVDSGPLILGVSASATVVAIGAARVHGDRALAGPLTGLGEGLGVPVGAGDTKRYAFGLLPVGDAFLAWSFAAPSTAAPSYPPVVRWWWRMPWHVLALTIVAVLLLPAIRVVIRKPRRAGIRGSDPGRRSRGSYSVATRGRRAGAGRPRTRSAAAAHGNHDGPASALSPGDNR
ncbi:hypothetical protein GCM10011588_51220 [Nocardia jinanensis]|uniref:Uncharacterized protein n=1 Tax=Nocardia jinanensis TaxID=382504 RepID=A0A917RTV7_9NOCA|nr:hypothetical protein GCM10011588_51220 [Nocardia jinanensis]